jgi:hypothetical protein
MPAGRVAWDANPTLPNDCLESDSMPTRTLITESILHQAASVGTDFVGGAEALPVKPAMPGRAVPGSDFAGGAAPLTVEAERGEPDQERAA